MIRDDLWEFIKANTDLSREETEKRLKKVQYDSEGWMEIRSACVYLTLRAAALRRAFETATSLADWIRIAERVEEPEILRDALAGIIELDIISEEDISLLRESSLDRLKFVGWYLDEKRKLALAKNK